MAGPAVWPRISLVLLRPCIPSNTGNIGRTCLGFGASLHVVEPQFDLSDKAVKRAGLDYWSSVDVHVHDDLDAFIEAGGPLSQFEKAVFLSKQGRHGTQRETRPCKAARRSAARCLLSLRAAAEQRGAGL